QGLAEAARFGTTTIANLTAVPELAAQFAEPEMRMWWFPEMIDVRGPVSAAKTLAAMRERVAGEVGLAPHAPYTASLELFRETADLVRAQKIVATTHLAESRDEMEMFRDGRGALFEFLQSIGRPMSDCGTQTPLALLLDAGVFDERWLIAHLNELTSPDLLRLENAPKFQVVHCPRSHAYFGHAPFAFRELRERGFNIALGTDSLASNHDLSLFAEMRQLARVLPALRPAELLEMVTTRAAAALQAQDWLGKIRTGFLADLIAIPFSGAADHAFESAVDFEGEVSWRMLNGALVSPR
ncbi:MAG: amidohydrolase family protein, partial [Verrucomicrobiota bacterium]|nr:amidohydrolase family protein [Verrucomicrobiota bacterium]